MLIYNEKTNAVEEIAALKPEEVKILNENLVPVGTILIGHSGSTAQ